MLDNNTGYREILWNLSRNNTNNSSTFNWYLAVLEWAEWFTVHRESINNYLLNLIRDDVDDRDEVLKDFGNLKSIREKIAFISNLNNTSENSEIEFLIEDIVKNLDLSESAIIRIAALNRFQISLSTFQKQELARIEKGVLDIVRKNVPALEKNLNFWNETYSQRILKIKEVLDYLIKNNIDTTSIDWFDNLSSLLAPLYELDKSYHELNHARNNFYDIQRWYWEIQVLSNSSKNRLEQALKLLTNEESLESFFETNLRNKLDSVDLQDILKTIERDNSDIEEQLKSLNMWLSDFQRDFLYYFSTENLSYAKLNHDKVKKETFKDKKRDFELDVKKYREIQRDRLLELCETWTIQELENIFERDRKLFLRTWNEVDDELLLEALDEILESRYPNTPIAVRDWLAQAILDENDVTNELYYWNYNYLANDQNDTITQWIVKSIWNTWRNIRKVWDYTTPIIGWFITLTRKTIELWWKTASTIINWTTWNISSIVNNYNTWANTPAKTFFWKIWKFPFKASQLITRPLSWWTNSINYVAGKTTQIISSSYNWINESIKNASNSQIDSLFDIFTQAYKHSIKIVWSSIEWWWDKTFDLLKTEQKRQILSEFYNSKTSSEVSSLLEAIDIQSTLKDSSPYVFDNDWFDNLWYDIVEEEKDDGKIKTLWINKINELILSINWLSEDKITKRTKRSLEQMKSDFGKTDYETRDLQISIKSIVNSLIKDLKAMYPSSTPEEKTSLNTIWIIEKWGKATIERDSLISKLNKLSKTNLDEARDILISLHL